MAKSVCPSLVTETIPSSHGSSSSFLTPLMGQPKQLGKSVFIESFDFIPTVNSSFINLKRIPSNDTSDVDPLAVPLSARSVSIVSRIFV